MGSTKKGGRKSKYETHVEPNLGKIAEWAEELTDKEIALSKLHIGVSTFEKYKAEHPEVVAELEKGRAKSRSVKIEKYKSLLEKRAEGFYYTETKKVIRSVDGVKTQVVEEYEKYSPPDVGALHLLLKNLDETWTNDDKTTISMKKEKLALDRLKAEMNDW